MAMNNSLCKKISYSCKDSLFFEIFVQSTDIENYDAINLHRYLFPLNYVELKI